MLSDSAAALLLTREQFSPLWEALPLPVLALDDPATIQAIEQQSAHPLASPERRERTWPMCSTPLAQRVDPKAS